MEKKDKIIEKPTYSIGKNEKHLIKEIPRRNIPNPYIGLDGRDYETLEALKQANEEYKRRMFVKNNSRQK
jgi:hypothetical protein